MLVEQRRRSGLIVPGGVIIGHALKSVGSAPEPPPITTNLIRNWDASGLSQSEGAAVGSVTDFSGSGGHATQVTGTKRPVLRRGFKNGLHVLEFDGTDDEVSNSIGADSGRTFFIVGAQAASTSTRAIGGLNNAAVFINNAGQWAWNVDGAGLTVNLGGVPTNWVILVAKVSSAVIMDAYVNGGAATNFDPNNSVTTQATMWLGSQNAAAFWNGYIAQVLVYSDVKNDADRATIRDWLNSKWAVY